MSVYYLARKQVVINTVPGNPAGFNTPIQANYDATNAPVANVTIQVVVNGSLTATVQPVGSNDGLNWENQGSSISVTTGHSSATVAAAPWAFWGAVVSAIGSSGSVDVLMSG